MGIGKYEGFPDLNLEDFEVTDDDTPKKAKWYWYRENHYGQLTVPDTKLAERKGRVLDDGIDLMNQMLSFLLDEEEGSALKKKVNGFSTEKGGVIWYWTSTPEDNMTEEEISEKAEELPSLMEFCRRKRCDGKKPESEEAGDLPL